MKQGISDRLLKTPPENVSFITWGNHMATNAYVDFSNIILAGTLFYRTKSLRRLEATWGGQKACSTAQSRRPSWTRPGRRRACILSCSLSAGDRSRKSDGASCHPCNAWIIASVQSRIPRLLQTIFPGCRQEDWRPVQRTLSGHVKAAIEYIGQHLPVEGSMLKFTQVSKALGMTAQNFRQHVRRTTTSRTPWPSAGSSSTRPEVSGSTVS